jgi:hypothetical protein
VLRVLFIGNSYTAGNGLPDLLAKLGQDILSPVSFSVAQHTPDGATWEDHDADPAVGRLIQRRWDYVVLQDQSEQPWLHRGAIKPALLSLDAKIQRSGAKSRLFMTWARRASAQKTPTRLVMNEAVNHYYERHAGAVGALVTPVGRAWERALRDPTVSLHAADGSHPNPRGTYLAACVFYATFTQRSPIGLGSGGLPLSARERTQLQQVAWDTHLARQTELEKLGGVSAKRPLRADGTP